MDLVESADSAGAVAIQVRGVSKVFGAGAEAVRALDDVSLEIRQNEFFTLLGPSGCGKTTLLRLIGGFEQPTAGEIFLEGQPLAHLPPFRRPINTVFQSYALFPHLTVADNIGFGLEMLGWEAARRRARTEEMLALVKLSGFERRKPAQLSGGQQQRVALARALASAPRVLLLDEPLSALDLKLRKEMQLELKRLQLETGITFIFVTHDQEEALTMSDRLAVMRDGEILQVGTPAEIYEHPVRRFVADFIGETNFLNGAVTAVEGERALVRLEAGGELPVPAAAVAGRKAVTLAVRPERVGLAPGAAGEGALAGRVEQIVYFGTDTIYHLAIPGAAGFKVRVQNREGPSDGLSVGDTVAVTIPPAAPQVLVD